MFAWPPLTACGAKPNGGDRQHAFRMLPVCAEAGRF
jgi:hypothetical protein